MSPENSSTDFSADQIRKLIDARTQAGFTFMFLGANHDSFAAGESIGMRRGNTRNFAASGDGARRVFEEVSGTLAQRRGRSRHERHVRKDEPLADKQFFRPRPGESIEDLGRRVRQATEKSRKIE